MPEGSYPCDDKWDSWLEANDKAEEAELAAEEARLDAEESSSDALDAYGGFSGGEVSPSAGARLEEQSRRYDLAERRADRASDLRQRAEKKAEGFFDCVEKHYGDDDDVMPEGYSDTPEGSVEIGEIEFPGDDLPEGDSDMWGVLVEFGEIEIH